MQSWTPTLPAGGDKPIYLAIVDALENGIRDTSLAAGSRLPPQRELARRLGVTVGTVSRAYIEAQRRGLIECGVGSGSFVRQSGLASDATQIDLRTNAPAFPEGIDARPLLEQALGGCLRGDALPDLLSPDVGNEGPAHRAAAVAWLARCGVDLDAASVLITAGAQHGLHCTLAALSRPGDIVLCDTFTNPGLLLAARQLHLTLVPVASDAEGLLPEAIAEASARQKPCAVYCQPTWANPTGATMSPARRAALADVLRAQDLLLIEDDDYGPLGPESLEPVARLAPDHVVYIASLSKSIGFGLRLAHVAAPARLRAALLAQVRASIWMTSPLVLEIASSWQRQGLDARLIQWRRDEAQARAALAREHLGIALTGSPGHVWLDLPGGWRGDPFVQHMERQGVLLAPGEGFATRPVSTGHVRLSLGAVAMRSTLSRALRIVADALKQPPTFAVP